mgnify:CR=1 FL=1
MLGSPEDGSVQIAHSHCLSDDDARQRVVALTDYWSTRYAMTGAWKGERYQISGKTKGIRFDAVFSLAPGRVEVAVEVPFFARKIGRDYVERKLRDYLDPARSLADLQARLLAP